MWSGLESAIGRDVGLWLVAVPAAAVHDPTCLILGLRQADIGKAKTVRVRNGQLLVTGGPFAETKEWIVGVDLLECKNIDEAIQIASKHPMARFGRLEVRPLWIGA
jgi:YCII-related domain